MNSNHITFLTSSPCTMQDDTLVLNPANGFVDALFELLPAGRPFLFVASDPANHEMASNYCAEMAEAFSNTGFDFPDVYLLDNETRHQAAEFVARSGVIFLAGGHVPTENAFFREISLRRLLEHSEAAIIGASAGSMNCADIVYACPENPEEVIDPEYRRFIRGLGLTGTMIMPHFQELWTEERSGLRVLEDIVLADSFGRTFIGLEDASFIVRVDGYEEICGPAYHISNGELHSLNV